jgi:hypothetical protein
MPNAVATGIVDVTLGLAMVSPLSSFFDKVLNSTTGWR